MAERRKKLDALIKKEGLTEEQAVARMALQEGCDDRIIRELVGLPPTAVDKLIEKLIVARSEAREEEILAP